MTHVDCSSITGYHCGFTVLFSADTPEQQVLVLLQHINAVHHPEFVPRCTDDLLVEYREFVEQISREIRQS